MPLVTSEQFSTATVITLRRVDKRNALSRALIAELRVAFEVTRVDLDAPDGPGRAKPDDRPVVTGAAPSLGLPAVAHVERASRHNQIVTMAEEHIAAREDAPALLYRRQINLAATHQQSLPVGQDLSVNAQAGHTSIGVNLQAQVRKAALVAD